MRKTVVVNVVGLCSNLIGEHTPFLASYVAKGNLSLIKPVIPAVTCTAQATYLTGTYPDQHGIVGNGWYFEEEAEVKFWRQSNRLVQGEKIWEEARKSDPDFTCANLFWWYNMYSTVDISVTPRPMYPADGRKIPDVYTYPMPLRDELQDELGQFPLFKFWGPATHIEVSQWIANSAKIVEKKHSPTLTLIYLPHLDYNSQRYGPDHPSVHQDLKEIDAVCEDLATFYEANGTDVVFLSEYGITPVDKAVHLNRELRKKGFIEFRLEQGKEMLDAGASEAFAVADHQIAHVYVKDKNRIEEVKTLLEQIEGVDAVWGREAKEVHKLNHPRSGDLVVMAEPKAWFTYYYWLEDKMAPDYARTVDIHRKPGYDPVEMFLNPRIWFPKLKVIATVLLRKLGFRMLMEVIPLDADLIGGSHGHLPQDKGAWPVLLQQQKPPIDRAHLEAHEVYELLAHKLGFSPNSQQE